ncbi:MAG: glycosyltransferase family 39 protein [Terriglobales bacterium]
MRSSTADIQFTPLRATAAPVNQRPWLRSPELWLVVLAFAVRIGFMLGARTYLFDPKLGDDFTYVNEMTNISRAIATGHGYTSPFAPFTGPTTWCTPVYTYLIATVFYLFGVFSTTSAIVILTLQSLMSAFTCIPIHRIGDYTAGRRTGLAAALAWAIFPWFSKWAVSWVWEVSASALLAALLFWYALRLARPASRKLWIGYGLLWAVALLTNPALATLLPPALLWCAWELRKQRCRWFTSAAVAVLVCFLTIAPWLVRNRIVFGQWVFLRSTFGIEFSLGNYELANGHGWGGPHPTLSRLELDRYIRMGEPAYNHWKLQQTMQWVRANPAKFLMLTARRVKYFWDGSALLYRPAMHAYWMPWSFLAFDLLLLPALLVAHRRRLHAWPMLFGCLLLYPLPYYIVFSQARYRHVLEPIMLVLVCFAAGEVIHRIRALNTSGCDASHTHA